MSAPAPGSPAEDRSPPAKASAARHACPITWRETLRRSRVDRARLTECCAERGGSPPAILLSPSFACVALHRLSRYCYGRGWRICARSIWQLNLWLTGADVSPMADFGEGLLVIHPVAVTLIGDAGRNLTVEGLGGLGGGLAMDDVGAGPGLPRLGDDVHLARGAMVLGPVRVGSAVFVGPGCTVVRDVPDGCEVLAQEVRVLRRSPPGATGDPRGEP
jgi:serine O-acetyltransferase